MKADDLSPQQCEELRCRLGPLVDFLQRLQKRFNDTGFPSTDPLRSRVTNSLSALNELDAELACRAMGGRGEYGMANLPALNARPVKSEQQMPAPPRRGKRSPRNTGPNHRGA